MQALWPALATASQSLTLVPQMCKCATGNTTRVSERTPRSARHEGRLPHTASLTTVEE